MQFSASLTINYAVAVVVEVEFDICIFWLWLSMRIAITAKFFKWKQILHTFLIRYFINFWMQKFVTLSSIFICQNIRCVRFDMFLYILFEYHQEKSFFLFCLVFLALFLFQFLFRFRCVFIEIVVQHSQTQARKHKAMKQYTHCMQ